MGEEGEKEIEEEGRDCTESTDLVKNANYDPARLGLKDCASETPTVVSKLLGPWTQQTRLSRLTFGVKTET